MGTPYVLSLFEALRDHEADREKLDRASTGFEQRLGTDTQRRLTWPVGEGRYARRDCDDYRPASAPGNGGFTDVMHQQCPALELQPGTLLREFRRICESLQLGPLASHPYCLRHRGASHDLLTRSRSLVEIQKRGRWHSLKSLRRYGKETRSLSEAAKLNLALVDYARQVESHSVSVLSGDFVPDTRLPKFCQP